MFLQDLEYLDLLGSSMFFVLLIYPYTSHLVISVVIQPFPLHFGLCKTNAYEERGESEVSCSCL